MIPQKKIKLKPLICYHIPSIWNSWLDKIGCKYKCGYARVASVGYDLIIVNLMYQDSDSIYLIIAPRLENAFICFVSDIGQLISTPVLQKFTLKRPMCGKRISPNPTISPNESSTCSILWRSRLFLASGLFWSFLAEGWARRRKFTQFVRRNFP